MIGGVKVKSNVWKGEVEKFIDVVDFFETFNYDLSSLKAIQLSIINGLDFSGVCRYPITSRRANKLTKAKGKKFNHRDDFSIYCGCPNRNGKYPWNYNMYVRPTFTTDENGTTWVQKNFRDEVFENENEAMVFLLGHELFHYLRKTKQIGGRNTQAQGNVFGFDMLDVYRARKIK